MKRIYLFLLLNFISFSCIKEKAATDFIPVNPVPKAEKKPEADLSKMKINSINAARLKKLVWIAKCLGWGIPSKA